MRFQKFLKCTVRALFVLLTMASVMLRRDRQQRRRRFPQKSFR